MHSFPIGPEDRALIEAARVVLRRTYRPNRHTVSSVVRTDSGRTYEGVSLEGTAHGPCAEWVALGAAFARNEEPRAIVAVTKHGRTYPVLSPCGACRQIMFDLAPHLTVILVDRGRLVKAKASDLLPGPYHGR